MRIVLAITAMLSAGMVQAQQMAAPAPIQIGSSHRLDSKPLGETRTINVVLPATYAKETGKRYPVLYLIDGGVEQDLLHVVGVAHLNAIWGRSAEAIVVGIETKDRRRELTGPTRDLELLKKYPTAGSSAAFRQFIRDEVKPLIEKSYRTDDQDAVLGESLAGLFIVETYLSEPALFDGYAAIDPSLWWDKEALSRTAVAKIGGKQKGRRIFLAMAKEQVEEPAGINRVTAGLKAKANGWCLAARPDLVHATIYQQLTPQALQFLLPPAEAPPPEFGFEVKCSAKS